MTTISAVLQDFKWYDIDNQVAMVFLKSIEENKEVIPAKVTGTFANVLNCYHKQTLLAKEFDNKMEFIIYIEDYQKEKFSSNTENEVSYIVFDKADLSLSIS
tara:strand:+ start:310 stop:615 length:306 start_codon:yes stop_codon:yes gene_type:complete